MARRGRPPGSKNKAKDQAPSAAGSVTGHNALTGRDSTVEHGPYQALPPLIIDGTRCEVAEGTGAMRAYEAMMYGVEVCAPEIRAAWRALLLEYCKLDTLAMLLIWEHWERAIAAMGR